MKNLTFNKFVNERKIFLEENLKKDHVTIFGKNNILISAPHGVSQVRLEKYKVHEIGSLATALYLQKQTNCFLIAKTKNNNDDANFDEKSEYKNSIRKLIKNQNIKYILDFHGLAAHRDCDVNLGINFGENIKNNIEIFDKLNMLLENNGFKVSIDQPFTGGGKTISGTFAKEFCNVWTIQIEINCAITNKKENFEKNKKLLNVFETWIKTIK